MFKLLALIAVSAVKINLKNTQDGSEYMDDCNHTDYYGYYEDYYGNDTCGNCTGDYYGYYEDYYGDNSTNSTM